MAILLLVAAPFAFSFRDTASLGWLWSWGASIGEMILGLAIVAAALSESVPGRAFSSRTIALLLAATCVLFVIVTAGSWTANPVMVGRSWWTIAGMCAAASAVSALPAVALSSVLIVRAYPVRPAVAGAIAGFGSGLLADAGWRLFCHYSEPPHVVLAHLSAIAIASAAGALLTRSLARY
jgi:hypothetical protein